MDILFRSSSSVSFIFFHSSPSCNNSGSSFHRWRTRHRNGGKLVHLLHLVGPEAPRGGWCICGAYLTQPKLAAFFCLSSLESKMWVSNPQVYSIQITKGLQVEVRTSLDRYLSGGKCAGVVHQRKDTTPKLANPCLKIFEDTLTKPNNPNSAMIKRRMKPYQTYLPNFPSHSKPTLGGWLPRLASCHVDHLPFTDGG